MLMVRGFPVCPVLYCKDPDILPPNCVLLASHSDKKSFSRLFLGKDLREGPKGSCPLRVFGQDDFPLRGRGVPHNSVQENSAKKQVF